MEPIRRFDLLWKAVAFEGGLLLLGWGLAEWLGFSIFRQLRVSWSSTLIGALATVPLLVALWWLKETSWTPMVRLRALSETVIKTLFGNAKIADIALISALAGVGEEVLFRGALQPWLAGALGMTTAIVVVSAAFGLVHFLSLSYAIYATLIGAYFGVLAVLTDSLWVPIVAHALYDFIALYYLLIVSKQEHANENSATD